MKEGITKWVHIARTGTFKDSSGVAHTFTTADFDAIKDGYNPKKSQAALCFGHPKDSDPAYGWIHALKREGGNFFAQFARVPEKVRELVDDGHYQYVSMSLTPDKKRILHVGLLGAVPPAIDGLEPVSFGGTHGICIDFSIQTSNDGGNMNLEELQKQVTQLLEKNTALQTECDQLKAKVLELETAKKEAVAETEKTAADFASFKDGIADKERARRARSLVDAGQLEPAKEQEVIDFAKALSGIAQPVNFSSGDGKVESVSAEEKYFRDLEAKEPAGLFASFSTPAPAHVGAKVSAPTLDTSKL